METAIILVFVIGYLAITLEHSIKIDKLIPALVMMAIAWALISLGLESFPNWFDSANHGLVEGFGSLPVENLENPAASKMSYMENTLLHHLGKTAEILVFLFSPYWVLSFLQSLIT